MQHATLVTVRVKPEIATRLEKLAGIMDRSKSYLAAEAIEEYLDIHEWQINAIEEGIAAFNSGKIIPFEAVKTFWEKKIEDSNY